MMSMRCFIAIELPESVRTQLAGLQEELKRHDWPVRWTRPEQIHLTVKFLGDVPDPDIPGLCAAIQEIARRTPPFTLDIGSAGCFPPRGRVRTIWSDVREPPPALAELQQQIESAMTEFGIARENRAYHPHLTIGRARNQGASSEARELLRHFTSFEAGAFDVEDIVLFHSELTPKGPIHTPIVRALLEGQTA